jgi:DNA-binding transcriptional MerR regulator
MDSLDRGRVKDFENLFKLYNQINYGYIKNLYYEINEIKRLNQNRSKQSKKMKEWASDISSQVANRQAKQAKLEKEFFKHVPKGGLVNFLFIRKVRSIAKKYNRKIKNVFENSDPPTLY